jgi:hypothetical protein
LCGKGPHGLTRPTHTHKTQLSSYDAHLFNIQGKVARNMHTQQLGVLQSAFEGLEDAGIPLHEIYRTRTGTWVLWLTDWLHVSVVCLSVCACFALLAGLCGSTLHRWYDLYLISLRPSFSSIHPQPIHTGVFVAAYTAFLPAADGPDETLLRGQIMSSLADQVRCCLIEPTTIHSSNRFD